MRRVRSDEQASADASRPTVRSPGPGILALQRGAGNRAVSRLLGARPPGPATVQRFSGHEHRDLGDSTGRKIDLGNGTVLTWGEVVALAGDEYATLDELLADTRDAAGKQRLRAALMHDGIAGAAASPAEQPTEAQVAARQRRFVELVLENSGHFNADGMAMGQWTGEHTLAVSEALAAGLANDAAARERANAREAFAQHFLTDSFSGGHIRTPRAETLAWYRSDFAPAVVDVLLRNLSNRVIDALTAQISPQTNWPDFVVRNKVSAAVGERLAAAIAAIGGRPKLVDYVALAVAGAVSGAMHDLEGERGVMVASVDHPQPWRAFGDDRLAQSPTSREQVERAVRAAAGELDTAYDIGLRHRAEADPASAPTTTYFGYASATLGPAALAEVEAARRHLVLRPEAQVIVTGHTDPIGGEAYNDGLGLRRAEAVAAALGVPADQVQVSSQGEHNPVTTDPRQYRLNRRVTYAFRSRSGPFRDVVTERAQTALRQQVSPPYPNVTRFVPRPVAAPNTSGADENATSAATQVELENWRWGRIPTTLRGSINTWVRDKISPLSAELTATPALDDQRVEGYLVQPRPVVRAMLAELTTNPVSFLERAFGRQIGP